MSENWTYKTMESLSTGLFKEKGSRFIGIVVACHTEEDVKRQLEKWHLEHPQAAHICYAYRLGLKGERYRANDDGEPSNSAGQPILGQLIAAGLTNVLCGVVRYYGGTKLGVGGLIHAYREAAKIAVDAGNCVEREEELSAVIEFHYNELPQVMTLLKRYANQIQQPVISEQCRVEMNCTKQNSQVLFSLLAALPTIQIINQ